MRRDRAERIQNDDFEEQMTELLAFLHHEFPSDHPFARIKVSPEMPGAPEVWLLGSSLWSAEAAAQFGLPYSFAHFFSPVHTRAAIEQYTESFRSSKHAAEPRKSVAVGVLCFVVGLALIWCNYHWFTDVVAGWALGAIIIQICLAIAGPPEVPARSP